MLTEERDGKSSSDAAVDSAMAGMSIQEVCDEFECVSSPAVEVTARQLARDIVENRQGNQRSLRCYATAVQYSVSEPLPPEPRDCEERDPGTVPRKAPYFRPVGVFRVVISVAGCDVTDDNLRT